MIDLVQRNQFRSEEDESILRSKDVTENLLTSV